MESFYTLVLGLAEKCQHNHSVLHKGDDERMPCIRKMSNIAFRPVATGLGCRPVLLKWLGGHHDDSDWAQVREVPYKDFGIYANHPLYHQFSTFDDKYQNAVKTLARLEKPESMTPFKMRGDFAAGPISSKWSLNFIWDTGRLLQEAVHQYIAKRVRKIFEDLAKWENVVRVNCNPYNNLEIWYTAMGYVLKYKTTFVENEAAAIQPEIARQEVFRILASRARQSNQSCASYENGIHTQLRDIDCEKAWQEAMAEAHCIRLANVC